MYKKIFFIIIFFLTFIFKSYANTNVFYIDLEFLINNSEYSKIVFQKLNNQIKENYENLNLEEKNLREEDKNLTQKKNIISSDEFELQLKLLSKKINAFNQKKQKISSDVNTLKQDTILEIINKFNPIIERYTNENDIDLLIDKKSVLISKKKFDITKEILEKINLEIN